MAEPINVVLMAPTKVGKTALLVHLRACAEYGHGLADNFDIEIDNTQKPAPPPAAARPIFGAAQAAQPHPYEKVLWSTLDDAEANASPDGKKFALGATAVAKPIGYPTKLKRSRAGQQDLEIDLTIFDAGGGIIFPLKALREEHRVQDSELREAHGVYREILMLSKGVVVCVDAAYSEYDSWRASFNNIKQLLTAPNSPIERIAIAFTKTERLFAMDGPRAISYALTHGRCVERLREKLTDEMRQHLRGWQGIEQEAGGRLEVRCFATSAFGYIFRIGSANSTHDGYMLINNDRLAQLDRVPPDNVPLNRYWRPLMTLDPFIYAAMGETDGFRYPLSFKLDELLQQKRDGQDSALERLLRTR